MKKIYQTTNRALMILFSMACLQAAAQPLSGVYSINSGLPASSTNYQSFTNFANDLNSLGVSGAVTVNVAANSGPYNEQVLFDEITGASSSNKITINGNDNLITYNASSGQRYTMGFNGSDFFEVNDLQMEGTGTYAFACLLYGGANYNMFSGCSFSVSATGSSSNQIPVVVSGQSTSYSSSSNSGSHNTWEGCSTYGGYIGISFYGPTSVGSYMEGNKVIDCHVSDFYYYGIRSYYNQNVTISGNLVERPNRTNHSTCYAMYVYYTSGSLVEKNTVQKLYEQDQTHTGTTYCFYIYGNTNTAHNGDPNMIRNNIVQDIRSRTTIYGFRLYYIKGDAIHNTLSIDHPTTTSGSVYGMRVYTTGDNYANLANNLIYINRGGSSSKYGIYYSSTSLVTSDYNNIWFGSAGSNKYAGYYSGAQTTLANLQNASGLEANSQDIDPAFVNASNDVTPTSATLNNLGTDLGVLFDHNNAVRNQTTPDIGAIEFLSTPCAGTPTQTVAGPDYMICAGESVTFSIGGLTSDLNFNYQWRVSDQSAFGPFTVVPGATDIVHESAPIPVTSWYSAIITCASPGGGSISAVSHVTVAGTTTNTAPYYEDFESIGIAGRLPNCSWSAPNIGSTANTHVGASAGNLLPHSGTSFAAFSNDIPGTDYFYSNGIYLMPGITYSASVWYQTDLTGANNWEDLSIMLGTSQNTTGLTTIASTGGPAVALLYKPLSNTFSVSSAGMYYVAIQARSASGTAQFLSWDDLRIEIPCSLNSPVISLNASDATICRGDQVVLTATGADAYTWDNNAGNGSVVSVEPLYNTLYTAVGTNSISGCSATASQYIDVNPSPQINVITTPVSACAGMPITLQAFGAQSYSWSVGGTGPTITDLPSGNMSYTVLGTNSFGCVGKYVHDVTVHPAPLLSVSAPTSICAGETAELNASGAISYEWLANSVYITNTPAYVSPQVSTIYTLQGTDANGCTSTVFLQMAVELCTGLNELSSAGLSLYPNPTNGVFTIEVPGAENKVVEVLDVTGRVIMQTSGSTKSFEIDLTPFASGIYYVKVSGSDRTDRIKVIKQ